MHRERSAVTDSATPLSRIVGSGEMADRIRAFPWQGNPLGPIETWSPELTAMVNMMLSTGEMAAVYWGAEMTLLFNDAYLPHLTNKPPALGQPYWKVWEEARHQVEGLIESPFLTGKTFVTPPVPLELVRNGRLEQTYYSMTGSPIFAGKDGAHAVEGVYLTLSDETANMLRAQQLTAMEARAGRILASIGDAVIVTDAESRIVTFNGVAEELTGWAEGDAVGRPIDEVYSLVSAGTREPVANVDGRVGQLGKAASLASDTLLLAADGTERFINESGTAIRGNDKEFSGRVLVFRDVSQARQDELTKADSSAVQELLLRLTDAQRNAANGREIVQVAAEMLGKHLDVGRVGYSEAAADLKSMHFTSGWTQGSLQPLSGSVSLEHWSEDTSTDFLRGRTVVYPDVREEAGLATRVGNYEEIGAIAVLAVPFVRRGVWKGSLYVNHPEPRQWTSHEVLLVEEVARRTSEAVERAHAEDELRILATRLGLAQEAGNMASWQWDFKTDLLVWDVGSEWTYGRPPSEMTRPDIIFSYIREEDRQKVRRDLMAAIEGKGEYRSEFRVLWPDGSEHWILAFGRTVWSFDGKPGGIVGININVTDQKHAASALMQTEKLAAVGRLASTMAHEINNPLEAVTNLLYLARQSSHWDEAKPLLETADAELRRAAAITNQALRFHKQATRPMLSTFEQLTNGMFKGRHSRLRNAGATIEERDRTSQPVLCFEGEIRQVLNNLVSNAIDALVGRNGKLLVRGRDGRDWLTGRTGMVLTLADTGSGMSMHTQKKLFDAFFTTKGVSGTGLGLWVSKEIIERHAGRLHLRSSERDGHRGTVFTIFLPYEAVVREAVIQ